MISRWLTQRAYTTKPESWFDRRKLIDHIRAALGAFEIDETTWTEFLEGISEDPFDQELAAMLTFGLGENEEYDALQFNRRYEMLRVLVLKHHKLVERYERGLELLEARHHFYSGWMRLTIVGDDYQLGDPNPWYKPVSPGQCVEMIRNAQGQPDHVLRDEGYERIDAKTYRDYVRRAVCNHELQLGTRLSEIDWLAHVMVFLTRPIKAWRRTGVKTLLQIALGELVGRSRAHASKLASALVPMQPLYSLPRESSSIQQFFLTREPAADIEEREQTTVLPGKIEGTSVKLVQEQDKQLALFFDKRLVNRKKDDTYIELELGQQGPEQLDTVGVLTKGLKQFDIEPTVFEHLPRIVAGMFAAAQRDRMNLDPSVEGLFWDTESGHRLCNIIGFNPKNKRHRKRIHDARLVLEAFCLNRTFETVKDGQRVAVRFKAPLIEARKFQIELSSDQREGIRGRQVFKGWSIHPYLWRLTVSRELGGAPAFMMLDERAFKLDDRSSVAFNIYWTLINRAYIAAGSKRWGVSEDGYFELRLGVLHDWAGMESSVPRPDRIKEKLAQALDAMLEQQLLLDWSCPALDPKNSIGLEELLDSMLEVQFPEEQRGILHRQSSDTGRLTG